MTDSFPIPADVVAEVNAAVDASRDELVALAQELVQIPSENPKLSDLNPGGEANVQDRVAVALEAAGATLDRWDALPGRPNLVGTVKGSGGGRSLAINGHVDVVPAGDHADWTYPPLLRDHCQQRHLGPRQR